MQRRTFCKTTLAAGVAASLQTSGAAAALNAITNISAVTTAGEQISIEKAAVKELGDSLTGTLILPDSDGYEAARRVWNGMIDRRPAMIARCATANDVANAVVFANERNLLLSVRGGAHNWPGKSTNDDGMVIDLSLMHDVTVDVENRTAHAGGGALLGQLDTATIAHNMITTTGVVSHTGIGGFTLGGGMGRVDRKFGLAVDNLLAATLVTADGQIRHLSADNEQDLFWAIRGGGGNFGVATELVYRVHPFDPSVYGGLITYPFDQAKDVLHFMAGFYENLPDECSVEPALGLTPEGNRFMMVEVCYAGNHATGEKVIAPLRAFGKPMNDGIGPQSFQVMQTQGDGHYGHGKQFYLKSSFLMSLTPEAIDAMIDNYEGDYLPDTFFQHLGGATSRVDPQATAFPHRHVHSNYGVSGIWEDPAESEKRIAKIRQYYAAIEPHTKGFYTNLNEDTEKKTWGNYGVNYPRLVEIKNKYDPRNLFRLNANIRPTV